MPGLHTGDGDQAGQDWSFLVCAHRGPSLFLICPEDSVEGPTAVT